MTNDFEAKIALAASKLLQPTFPAELKLLEQNYAQARQAHRDAEATLRAAIIKPQPPNPALAANKLREMQDEIDAHKQRRYEAKAAFEAAIEVFGQKYRIDSVASITDSVAVIHDALDLLDEACAPLVRLAVECGKLSLPVSRPLVVAVSLQRAVREARGLFGPRD